MFLGFAFQTPLDKNKPNHSGKSWFIHENKPNHGINHPREFPTARRPITSTQGRASPQWPIGVGSAQPPQASPWPSDVSNSKRLNSKFSCVWPKMLEFLSQFWICSCLVVWWGVEWISFNHRISRIENHLAVQSGLQCDHASGLKRLFSVLLSGKTTQSRKT